MTRASVPCPNIEDHTQSPEGYIQWHSWAAKMSETHDQRKCEGCGRFEIWEPRLPSERVRDLAILEHRP